MFSEGRKAIPGYNGLNNIHTIFIFYFKYSKFEMQYEWTALQILFCGQRVLQLFYDNVETAHTMKCNLK